MISEPGYGRTRNSLRNSATALILQVVAMLIGFFSRRIFIRILGVEVMGLNTTASSILDFLNLAELGIETAVAVTLYKPLFSRDEQSIKEIVALQGRLYRIIGSFVLAGSLVVFCFIPRIFGKSPLPLWYSYATYGVLLYSSLLWYFFNYKKNVLFADQKNYKVLLCTKLVALVKLILQTLAVFYLEHGYIWWLGLEAVSATISAILIGIIVHRNYPFLREKVPVTRALRQKYPDIIQKTRYIAFHKLGGYAVAKSSPIFIYAFTSLAVVGYYGNYLILTTNLTAILTALYSGVSSGIGNMVVEGNKKLIMKVFRELFSSRMLIVGVCCLCLWFLTDPFVSIWLGPEYVLGHSTLALIIFQFYISNTRNVVDDYLTAHGLFHDIWSPIAEAAINACLSILLGRRFGLDGVLAGVIISQVIITLSWKPFFLFRSALHEPLSFYISLYARCLVPGIIAFVTLHFLLPLLPIDPSASFWLFLVYAVVTGLVAFAVYGGLLSIWEDGLKDFTTRIIHVLRHR